MMAEALGAPVEGRGRALKRARAFDGWVRQSALRLFCDRGAAVAEFACGKFGHASKLSQLQIGRLLAVDHSRVHLTEAKQRLADAKITCPAEFAELDVAKQPLDATLEGARLVHGLDLVCCHGRLHNAFAKEERARQLLRNIALSLRDGGFFVGIVLDPQVVWTRAQRVLEREPKATTVEFRGDLYSVVLKSSGGTKGGEFFRSFGMQLTLTLADGTVHAHSVMPSAGLSQLAAEEGLDVLHLLNFREFFAQYGGLFFEELRVAQAVDSKGRVPPAEMDYLSLFALCVLTRTSSPRPRVRDPGAPQPPAKRPRGEDDGAA